MSERSKISPKNKYWILPERYLELRHFCKQYNIFVKARRGVNNLVSTHYGMSIEGHSEESITERAAKQMMYYDERINMIEDAVHEADDSIYDALLMGVTQGLSYDKLCLRATVPCCKEYYYDKYRKFFYILNRKHY